MKKVLIIYNPASGGAGFVPYIDQITAACITHGYLPTYYRVGTCRHQNVFEDIHHYQLILSSGGDGTLNYTVNELLQVGADVPVGIIPSGTANDFANALGIRGNPVAVAEQLLTGKEQLTDVGWVNGRYFINVISTGILADVAYDVNQLIKRKLGVTAYYLRGLQSLSNLTPIPLQIESDAFCIEDRLLLLLVVNSTTAGTFKNIAPKADLSDGMLDVLLLKKCTLPKLINILLEAYKGKGTHLTSPLVEYHQVKWLNVQSPHNVISDVDGEEGPGMPLEIKVLPKKLRLLVPNNTAVNS